MPGGVALLRWQRRHESRRGGIVKREIQALTFELRELRRRAEPPQPELHAKEREVEQLRWRFAAIARQAATDDLGNAA